MTQEKIARINELAKKSKTTGLTAGERAAQPARRREDVAGRQARRRARVAGTIHKVTRRAELENPRS